MKPEAKKKKWGAREGKIRGQFQKTSGHVCA